MKKILSISLGSSRRNKTTNVVMENTEFEISRIGTDGDVQKLEKLMKENDSKVDVFGLGGFDFYVFAGKKKVAIPKPHQIVRGLKTPVFDGSILKLVLEPLVIEYYSDQLNFKDLKAFCLVGAERFGMAEALNRCCKSVTYGDLLMSVGLPIPFYKFSSMVAASKILAPLIVKLPFKWLYPTGESANKKSTIAHKHFYYNDIIAGDCLYICKHIPEIVKNKIIITNTTTEENMSFFKKTGAKTVITTTPDFDGRTFGTNVIEALLYLLINKSNPTDEDFKSKILQHNLNKGGIVHFS